MTGKRVINAIDNDEEAYVELEDGSVERGDLVVACDGVHSTVRDAMWNNANRMIPDFITTKEKESKSTPVDELARGQAKSVSQPWSPTTTAF